MTQSNGPDLSKPAISYAERGMRVFPVQEGGKTPLPKSHGCKEAIANPFEIEKVWERNPSFNIGIATGGHNTLYVVDIDIKNGKDGREPLADLERKHGPVPATLMASTPTGGLHYYFKGRKGLPNTSDTLGQGIDTRGEGGYVVAPPSVTAQGYYRWLNDGQEIADLPDWLVPSEEEEKELEKATPRTPTYVIDPGERVRRAMSYVGKMPESISGQGGHNAAFAAARVIVHGFELDGADARAVFDSFNQRCDPPWSDTEIEHKLQQARDKPSSHPRGWLVQEDEPDQIGVQVTAKLLAKVNEPGERAKPEPKETPKFPAKLLQPPGILGDLCAWITQTSHRPQPILTLGNVLAFGGAVCGRKIQSETNLRTNIYTIGVGESGCGKDHSRQQIRELCAEAGAMALLGGEDITSGSALMASVHRSPSLLFQIDEVGHFFSASTNRNAAHYQKDIPVTFTKLYSSAGGMMLGKEYADASVERRDIDQPNACLYGSTVPGRFFDGLSRAEIEDGFLGRSMLFVSEDPDPDRRPATARVGPPTGIVEWVQGWRTWVPPKAGKGNLADVARPKPFVVKNTPEARAVQDALYQFTRSELKKYRDNHSSVGVLWTRAYENAVKVALVITAGCGGPSEEMVITGEVMEYATELVKFLIENAIREIEDNLASSEYELLSKKVLAYIREGGERTGLQVCRKFRDKKAKERNEALAGLLEAGSIEVEQVPPEGAGRPFNIYKFLRN